MSYSIESSSTTCTLTDPKTVSRYHVRKTSNFTMDSGDYAVYDSGLDSRGIILTGLEVSTASTKMKQLNDIMNNKGDVTVSGLNDSNLDGYYLIKELAYSRPFYERYEYTVTLENTEV